MVSKALAASRKSKRKAQRKGLVKKLITRDDGFKQMYWVGRKNGRGHKKGSAHNYETSRREFDVDTMHNKYLDSVRSKLGREGYWAVNRAQSAEWKGKTGLARLSNMTNSAIANQRRGALDRQRQGLIDRSGLKKRKHLEARQRHQQKK